VKNNKNKSILITGGQIITVIGLIAGIITNYHQNQQNDTAIKGNSSWMVSSLKEQSEEIKSLQISNAILTQEMNDFKFK